MRPEDVEQLIRRAIADVLSRKDLNHRRDDPRRLHVTELLGCLRKAYYERMFPARNQGEIDVRRAMGHAIHMLIQEGVRGPWVAEYPVEHIFSFDGVHIMIVGSVDLYSPSYKTVIELKATTEAPKTPYKTHKLQVAFYKIMTGAERAYICYIGRTRGTIKCFDASDATIDLRWLEERAIRLYKALKTRTPPPPEPNPGLCRNCDYQKTCRNAGGRIPLDYMSRTTRARRL